MKKLEIRDPGYTILLKAFKQHLEVLNYSGGTVYNAVNYTREYLFYLETTHTNLRRVQDLAHYFQYLEGRVNERRGGGLSTGSLHKHRSCLRLFYDFLRLTQGIESVRFPLLPRATRSPVVLTVAQVKQLFDVCDSSLLGKRNKALLALYYGLGLRRSEGVNLELTDMDFPKEEVLIRKSKTHRQRVVPMSDYVKEILEDYVFNVREKLIPDDDQTACFLVTERGKPLSKESVSYLIRKLVKSSKIKQKASVHTLRHSIATHLLNQGMSLENIALFLGHTSLDSTQLYTHLNTKTDENI